MAGADEEDSTTIMMNPTATPPAPSIAAEKTQKSAGTASVVTSTTSSNQHAKEELWKDAFLVEVPEHPEVQVQWFELKKHTIFARAIVAGTAAANQSPSDVSIGKVVEVMVDETWKRTAKAILETKKHVTPDSYPPALHLLELGAVWLLNEELYCQGHGAHAHRLHLEDEPRCPDWTAFTLRVHMTPERHFAADLVDWGKFCKGLLLNSDISVSIAGVKPHLPILSEGALPDDKDGAIVYEDDELGFAVLNKPGNVPIHPSLSNHTEDVVSKFTMALHDKKKQMHVSLPNHYPEIDTEAQGLVCVATKSQFSAYMLNLLKEADTPPPEGEGNNGLVKVYKCLVCVKDPDRMGLLEAFQKTGKLITHFCDPVHHRFARRKPEDGSWHKCQLRVKQVGDESFRAACVSTVYEDSVDSCLAHRLWGPKVRSDVQYVMELQVETVGRFHAHQVRGQLAALGFPIVGDFQKGGGKVSVFHERHEWKHMALQCCELSFPVPIAAGKKGEAHHAGEGRCVFRLNSAWWSEYLRQYELYHVRG